MQIPQGRRERCIFGRKDCKANLGTVVGNAKYNPDAVELSAVMSFCITDCGSAGAYRNGLLACVFRASGDGHYLLGCCPGLSQTTSSIAPRRREETDGIVPRPTAAQCDVLECVVVAKYGDGAVVLISIVDGIWG